MYKRYHTKENYTNDKIKKTKDKIAKDKFQEDKNKRITKNIRKAAGGNL